MLQTLNLNADTNIDSVSGCDGAVCAFACSGGCIVGCLIGGGTTVAFGALGGTFGGSGTSIATAPAETLAS
jgi:hypothetical protein